MNDVVPAVTVITPVYNASRFLPRLIHSVRSQHGVSYEHILIDDCSTDNGCDVIRHFAENDSRIRLFQLDANSGPIVARNAGIAQARGRYLAFLDADDVWLPSKLLVQSRFMDERGAALTFTDYRFISEDGLRIGRRLNGPDRVDITQHYKTRSGLGCLTVMIDRQQCPDFNFANLDSVASRAEDYVAWAQLIKKVGAAYRVPYDLARYSVVPGSRSSNTIAKAEAVWVVYRAVENLSLPMACYYFLSFAVAALTKRWIYRPKGPLRDIDGELGEQWLSSMAVPTSVEGGQK